MDIDFTTGELLAGQELAIEYEAQRSIKQEINREILIESSASSYTNQRKVLQELREKEDLSDKLRVKFSTEGTSVKFDVYFVNLPENLEDYAEIIKSNALTKATLNIKDIIVNKLSIGDARDLLFDKLKNWTIDQIQRSFGGA